MRNKQFDQLAACVSKHHYRNFVFCLFLSSNSKIKIVIDQNWPTNSAIRSPKLFSVLIQSTFYNSLHSKEFQPVCLLCCYAGPIQCFSKVFCNPILHFFFISFPSGLTSAAWISHCSTIFVPFFRQQISTPTQKLLKLASPRTTNQRFTSTFYCTTIYARILSRRYQYFCCCRHFCSANILEFLRFGFCSTKNFFL